MYGCAIADYNRPETLDGAFAAGDKVLLISGSEVGQRASAAHRPSSTPPRRPVSRCSRTPAFWAAPPPTSRWPTSTSVTEQAILDSGLPYALLRNGWYNENYTENLAPVLEHGAVVGAAGEGRVASASRADYAAAAVAVLTGEGHESKAYELSGDTAWSFAEYAAEVAEQTGKEIAYSAVSAEPCTRAS